METLIKRFCDTLRQKFGLPVYTCDESYTSTDAYHRLKTMRQAGHAKKIAKGDIDAMAAAIVLESWIAAYSSVP
jgi:putative Holliday junction resolvase